MSSKTRHKRKTRRRGKAVAKFGKGAARKHTCLAGRSGTAGSKVMKSRQPRK